MNHKYQLISELMQKQEEFMSWLKITPNVDSKVNHKYLRPGSPHPGAPWVYFATVRKNTAQISGITWIGDKSGEARREDVDQAIEEEFDCYVKT